MDEGKVIIRCVLGRRPGASRGKCVVLVVVKGRRRWDGWREGLLLTT
jgi:hypothetical protein